MFHRVICLGGGLINSWTVTNQPKELALRFGKAVGIETQDTAELMSKLKEIETEKLVHANEALTKEDVRYLKTQLPLIKTKVINKCRMIFFIILECFGWTISSYEPFSGAQWKGCIYH